MIDRSRILIVDDDSVGLELLRSQLRPSDSAGRCARGGAAGLAAAFQDIPDPVLSDVVMPDVDGFELVRQLKANDATRAVPVVLAARSMRGPNACVAVSRVTRAAPVAGVKAARGGTVRVDVRNEAGGCLVAISDRGTTVSLWLPLTADAEVLS